MAVSPDEVQFAVPQSGEHLHVLAQQVRRTLKSPSKRQVHHLRVAIRRYSQVLAVVEDEIGRRSIEKIRQNLRRTMHLAGAVRDCDIAMKLVDELEPPERLKKSLERRRAAEARKLVASLRTWVDGHAAMKWRRQMEKSVNGAPVQEDVAQILTKALKRLFARGHAAEKSPKKLHPLRIAAKKLRYTLDLLPPPPPAFLEEIKALQSKLGEINDFEMARRIVARATTDKKIPKQLRKKRSKKIREFHEYWQSEFAGKSNRKKWTDAMLKETVRKAVA
jgi:CHAD domain-containing protein